MNKWRDGWIKECWWINACGYITGVCVCVCVCVCVDRRKEGSCWVNASGCESTIYFFGRLNSVYNTLLKMGRKQHWRTVIP